MATYHVNQDPETNTIRAGTINKKGDRFINFSDVTEECLVAIRNHFLWIMQKEKTLKTGYVWNLENGKSIILQVSIEDKPEIREKGE